MPKTKPIETKTSERGADEVPFLPSRQHTEPRDPRLARLATNDFVRAVLDADALSGRTAHDQGTTLGELYMTHADKALGFSSFRAYLEKHWPLDLSLAYERMKVARLVTRAQATRYGFSACQLGLRIMSAKKIDSFDAFLKVDLPLPEEEGGGTIRFPAPASSLRSVLRVISGATDEPADDADAITQRLRGYRQAITRVVEEDPDIAALKPVAWCDHKDAYVRLTASGPIQTRAAIRLLQKLAKVK